jgi:vitamin B12 transporter
VQRLSIGADYDHTKVRNEDSYGLELDDETTRTWSVFLEDRVSLFSDRLVATAGIRRDDHSAFGSHTSPRAAISYRVVPALKVRVAGGGAFRSPTTGELFYPFSGNRALRPERSVSYEVGVEWDVVPALTLEVSLFRTDVRDLIQYDFATGGNTNVGRARMSGVELIIRKTLGDRLFARASYTYLDATDRDTELALLRRPRHRASATVGRAWGPTGSGATAELSALYTGARRDVDSVTFLRVDDPSYVRVDLAVTSPRLFGRVAPFARVTNLFGRDYAEVAGFPAPGRRFLVGLEAGF